MAGLKKQIGSRIRQFRHERPPGRGRRVQRMTIEDLAERADLSADYVTKLEQGKHSPSADKLAAIADALGIELFPSVRGSQAAALDELIAYVSKFSSAEIRYFIEIIRVVVDQRPKRKPRPLT